jgi:hypothetical protein
MFMDGRIYVFGGCVPGGTACPQLAWVYDMEKSTWFALEISDPYDQDFSTCQKVPISNSKVLVVSGDWQKKWVFEIYQSKLTEVEGQLGGRGTIVGVRGELVSCWEDGWEIMGKEVVCEKVSEKQ